MGDGVDNAADSLLVIAGLAQFVEAAAQVS